MQSLLKEKKEMFWLLKPDQVKIMDILQISKTERK